MRKHYKAEEVVAILHEAESSPESVTDFCRRKAISEKTFYRCQPSHQLALPQLS